jgi:hypothetical protein
MELGGQNSKSSPVDFILTKPLSLSNLERKSTQMGFLDDFPGYQKS